MAEVTVTVSGYVGADPTLNTGASGVPWTQFSVGSTRRHLGTDGQWADAETVWYRVSAFRDHARNVVESLRRGTPVIVTGRLRVEDFQVSKKVTAASGVDVEVLETRRNLIIENPTIGIDLKRGSAIYMRRNHNSDSPGAATPPQGVPQVAASSAGEVAGDATGEAG